MEMLALSKKDVPRNFQEVIIIKVTFITSSLKQVPKSRTSAQIIVRNYPFEKVLTRDCQPDNI